MMNRVYPLILVVAISACANPQGAGFQGIGEETTPEGFQPRPAPIKPAPNPLDVEVDRGLLSQAARKALASSSTKDAQTIDVVGRPMSMQVLRVQGYSFAVLRQTGGAPSGIAPVDLSQPALQAAKSQSGCAASGNTWRQTNADTGLPDYAVHLIC